MSSAMNSALHVDQTVAEARRAVEQWVTLREQARHAGERAGLLLTTALARIVLAHEPETEMLDVALSPDGAIDKTALLTSDGIRVEDDLPAIMPLLAELAPLLGASRARLSVTRLEWSFPD